MENLDPWKIKMPPLDDWRTFQDAISVTRYLGLRYIWIDSLCIVQDSIDDWRSESMQMSNVYKFTTCNISATSAKDDTEGCFFSRDITFSTVNPICLNFVEGAVTMKVHGPGQCITIPSRPNSRAFSLGKYELFQNYALVDWREEVASGHVSSRGWVLQERVLSPRVLHFCTKQLYWECTELQASEAFPFGLPEGPDLDAASFKAQSPFSLLSHSSQLSPLELFKRAMRVWGEAVSAFSSARLTYVTDNLVAISAIAKELKPHFRCRYPAGHWETDLVHQLSWTCSGAVDAYGTGLLYLAPSWSWASTNLGVDHFEGIYEWPELHVDHRSNNQQRQPVPLADLLECHVELASADDTGQVKGGFLKLRGQLLQVEYEDPVSSRIYHCFGDGTMGRAVRRIGGTLSPITVNYDGWTHANADLPLGAEVSWWLLPIEVSFKNERPPRMHLLLLKKMAKNDYYTRAGVCKNYYPNIWQSGPSRKDPFNPLYENVALEGKRIPDAFDGCSGITEVTIF